jgi:hypothetical protein
LTGALYQQKLENKKQKNNFIEKKMPMAQNIPYSSITELRYKDLRFLITDSPDDENVQSFTEVKIKKNNQFFFMIIFFIGLFKIWCYSISSSFRKDV